MKGHILTDTDFLVAVTIIAVVTVLAASITYSLRDSRRQELEMLKTCTMKQYPNGQQEWDCRKDLP
jgi:hypothetical protein